MFTEAQYFAPVTHAEDGTVEVHLGADHPGFSDQQYRARRNAIAALALGYTPGQPIPHAEYTDAEHQVWRTISRELTPKHCRYAVREFLQGQEELRVPTDHIPQLEDVGDLLQPLTGYRYFPAAGLVPLRQFYCVLSDDRFFSTQYIRHYSQPLYTPEPDIVHEVIGHANTLADPTLASLYRAAGRAARRVHSDAALEFVSHVFWFSLEFGVCYQDAAGGAPAREKLRTYGAGILSSYGEIDEFRDVQIRPLDIAQMGTQTYDIGHYQPLLFAGRSMAEVVDVVGGFFDTVTDDTTERYRRESETA